MISRNFARSSVFDVEPTHTLSTLAARKLLGRRNHQNSEDNGYATEDHSGRYAISSIFLEIYS